MMVKMMTSTKTNVISIYDKKQDKTIKYYMDKRLHDNLAIKIIPSLEKKDKDCVLALDGAEGSGKSTLALQIGKKVDPTLDLSRVVFDAESFRQAIFKAKKGQCVIFDEAFTGLSSRASLSGMNRALVGLMMQMRQKNLFVIIVLPTFFLLDKYVALFRTKALIHVYEAGGRRGYFKLYNRKLKKYLYLAGKTTYSYSGAKWKVRTKFAGRFYGVFALGDEKVEDKYREMKAKALEATEKNPMTAGQVKYKEQRDIILFLLRKISNNTYEQLANLLADYDLEMTYVQVRNICAKFGDREKEKVKIVEKIVEVPIVEPENDQNIVEIDESTQLNPQSEEKDVNFDENVVKEDEIDEKEPFGEKNEEFE